MIKPDDDNPRGLVEDLRLEDVDMEASDRALDNHSPEMRARLRAMGRDHTRGVTVMPRDRNLYEVCPMCQGTGRIVHVPVCPSGYKAGDTCPGCKPLHVVAVGVTTGQLERMVKRELAAAEDEMSMAALARKVVEEYVAKRVKGGGM